MRKLTLILLPVLLMLFGIFLLSGWSKEMRSQLWRVFDKDALYLNDGSCIYGWVWNETDEAVMGKKENGDIFTVQRAELKYMGSNVLLAQLKQIL